MSTSGALHIGIAASSYTRQGRNATWHVQGASPSMGSDTAIDHARHIAPQEQRERGVS